MVCTIQNNSHKKWMVFFSFHYDWCHANLHIIMNAHTSVLQFQQESSKTVEKAF